MSPDVLVLPLIGLVGIAIGIVARNVLSGRQAARKKHQPRQAEQAETAPEKAETMVVLDEAVDSRELRILRALFGESKGRSLGSFKGKYYRPSLEATIKKGWVMQSGSRYFITPKGGEFCRTYLKQLLDDWRPADQV